MKLAPITLTDIALSEVKNIFENKNIPAEYYLRVGVKGSGCAGVSYLLGFDKKGETDELYSFGGIEVLIAKKDFMYLFGLEVDYVNSAEETGFVFNKEENV
ncbi:MAG: iron-sulfur cluster assembly accessory protein [Cytophagales bacterium]|nr:iron-sulfur cluster assembly accessory protein [Cytophagales bacterium]